MSGKKLYFIALIPPEELRMKVKALKEEIRDTFGAKHALKLPAHITLQPPFSLAPEQEPELLTALKSTAGNQKVFWVGLRGFGSFPPRVIYIKVEEHEIIRKLHSHLQDQLKDLLSSETGSSIHPHMTLASRDLKKKDFKTAWAAFEKRQFEDSFLAESMYLLRHNDKRWDIIREIPFSKD